MKTTLLATFLLAAAVSSPVLAQTSTNATNGSQSTTSSNQNQAIEKIQDDLKKAGFTDIKVVAESFVVQGDEHDDDGIGLRESAQHDRLEHLEQRQHVEQWYDFEIEPLRRAHVAAL